MNTLLHALLRSAVVLAATLTVLPAQDTGVAEAPHTAADPAATPFLWRIEGETPGYLFGTIHLPDPRVNALHPRVREALDAADAVYTELEMTPEVMREVQQATVLEDGRVLQDVLPEPLYTDLKEWLGGHGMAMQPFTRMKPWALMAQLPMIPHLRELMQHQPLDMRLYARAKAAGKEVGGLETPAEQLGVFRSFTEEQQVRMLRETLDEVVAAEAAGDDLMEELIALYVAGDAQRLMERMHEEGFADDELQEQLLETLLWQRNERMVERIVALREQRPETTFFFAVGAAHFPDERGILELLRERGLQVTRLPQRATERIRALERENRRLREELERLREQLRKRKAG